MVLRDVNEQVCSGYKLAMWMSVLVHIQKHTKLLKCCSTQ